MGLSGKKVGWIHIEKRLGHGGMGNVYLGFHEKLKRSVAVKAILESKRLSEHARTRFLREARALSRLDHPNICRIYDYMEEYGQDYLVLELIEGRGLKSFIAENPPMTEKIRVAHDLADALAAAHEKGVIHRDVKPDNVMITPDGTVKVLDFGISRTEHMTRLSIPPTGDRMHLDPDSLQTLTNAFTQQGALVGTLQYMSPEQARGEDTTAASDMYALGLVLQELFTGEPAYEQGIPFMPMLRKAAAGESKPIRGLDEDLTKLLNRLKSMVAEARPGARETAERLSLIASKPARRRKRRLVYGAVSALAIFALVMALQAFRIRKEVDRANREAQKAREAAIAATEVSEFVQSIFELVDPNQAIGKQFTAEQLLDRATDRVARLTGSDLDRARMMVTLGRLYRQLALYDRAEPLLQEALLIRRRESGEKSLEAAESLAEMSELFCDQGRLREAVPLGKEALSIMEHIFGEDHISSARVLMVLSRVNSDLENITESHELAQKALTIREAFLDSRHPDVGASLAWVAALLDLLGDDSQAEKMAIRAVGILEKTPNKKDLIEAFNTLAKLRSQRSEFESAGSLYQRALELSREVLGPEHPRVGDLLNNVAVLHANQEQHNEALLYFQQAHDVWLKAYGKDHPTMNLALSNIAMTQLDLGRVPEAIATMESMIEDKIRKLGPRAGSLVVDYLTLSRAYIALNDYEKARTIASKADGIAHSSRDVNIDLVGVHFELIGETWLEARRYKDAENWLEMALKWWDRRADQTDIMENRVKNLNNLATIMRATNREDEALVMEQQARELEDEIKKTEVGI